MVLPVKTEWKRLLGQLFLFDGLAPNVCELLAETARIERFERGAVIYSPHCFQRCLGVVLEGTVAVDQAIGIRRTRMRTMGVGQVFGAAALYGGDASYVTEISAKTACAVAFFDQAQISGWLSTHPRIAENYIRFLSDRIRFLNRRITTLSGEDVQQKLAVYLQAVASDAVSVNMVQLAQQLNVGRSSLYRALDALEQAGQIRREGKRIQWIGEDQV